MSNILNACRTSSPFLHLKKYGTNPGETDSLTESIRGEGVREPLVVFKRGDEYVLIEGHNRIVSAEEAGLLRFRSSYLRVTKTPL